mmetsp:Transcript_15004/g.34784  ORF Transcript_15004/g.34784 Transcript_15004/m.34784 type:complete len:122 (-) Transcript_15004:31-396(-)
MLSNKLTSAESNPLSETGMMVTSDASIVLFARHFTLQFRKFGRHFDFKRYPFYIHYIFRPSPIAFISFIFISFRSSSFYEVTFFDFIYLLRTYGIVYISCQYKYIDGIIIEGSILEFILLV